MKALNTTLLFVLLGFPALLTAQHRLEAGLNFPLPGDKLYKQQVAYKDPGRSGLNVLWDFSQLEIKNDAYRLLYDTIGGRLVGTEHRTRYYYRLSGDSLLQTGFENATTLMENTQPEFLRRFPVCFGDSFVSYFQGKGRYGDRLEVDMMGTIDFHADATGTLILPGGDTLRSVLRLTAVKRLVEDLKPLSFHRGQKISSSPPAVSSDSIDYRLSTDSLVMEIATCSWYARGYRYPVFETIFSRNFIRGAGEDYFSTAFFYPPEEQRYLEDDEANRLLREAEETNSDPWSGLTWNIHPNPVKDSPLTVELELPRNASIRIQLRNTLGNIVLDQNKGYYPPGVCSFQLSLQALPVQNYVLNILLDDHLISEIIMKR